MRQSLVPKIKTSLGKIMGIRSPGEEIRRQKFMLMTGTDWDKPPTVYCTEKERIHPKLIGRFYGENNIKKCALEIRRINGQIALRYAWRIRSRHTWANKGKKEGSNQYHSLVIEGSKIGNRKGLFFARGTDGRYYLGYKRFMEIIMKKV